MSSRRFITFFATSWMSFCLHQSAQAGVLLVANKSSNTVTLFDEPTLEKLAELPTGNYPHEVALSPSENWAVVSNYGGLFYLPGSTLTVIDVQGRQVARTLQLPPRSRPHGIQFISDHEILVTVEGIQSFLHMDIESGEIIRSVQLPGAGAHLFVVDDNQRFAYIANTSGSVVKVSLDDFSVLGETKIGRAAEGIALAEQGTSLLVTNRKDSIVAFLRTDDLSITGKIDTQNGPIRLQMFDDGRKAAITCSVQGTVQIIDVETRSIIRSFRSTDRFSFKNGKVSGGIFGALSVPITLIPRSDGKTAYVANSFAGNISVVDLFDGEIVTVFEASAEPDGMALGRN